MYLPSTYKPYQSPDVGCWVLGVPDWFQAARLRWAQGHRSFNKTREFGVDADQDPELAWRQIFGVSRLNAEEEVDRYDAGEDGTLIRYASGRVFCHNLNGNAAIGVLMRAV